MHSAIFSFGLLLETQRVLRVHLDRYCTDEFTRHVFDAKAWPNAGWPSFADARGRQFVASFTTRAEAAEVLETLD